MKLICLLEFVSYWNQFVSVLLSGKTASKTTFYRVLILFQHFLSGSLCSRRICDGRNLQRPQLLSGCLKIWLQKWSRVVPAATWRFCQRILHKWTGIGKSACHCKYFVFVNLFLKETQILFLTNNFFERLALIDCDKNCVWCKAPNFGCF